MRSLWVLVIVFLNALNSSAQVNLLKDPNFSRGFSVYMVEDGIPDLPLTIRKIIVVDSNQHDGPVWQLAQWNNYNNKIENAAYSKQMGIDVYRTRFGNEFRIDTANKLLRLKLNTSSEYGKNKVSPDNPRKEGQKWPHLLISQDIENPAGGLANLRSVEMQVTYAILSIKNNHSKKNFNKNLHSAQFQWFLSIKNNNQASPGFGDYFWFGLSLYDFRHQFAPKYANMDFNTTAKFIYMPDMKEVLSENNAIKVDSKGQLLKYDVFHEIKEAFLLAKENGFLKDSQWEDLYISHCNIGWEIPGSFDVCAQIQDLGIIVKKFQK
ncbi:hypothetical protein [Sphingobacterium endophyticum]|uniref:hypothetical protein n=1 Tax=Sphingobacterium endophyticum TaxID=2546448 RepID=UPI0012E0E525|nr:hypothetical protein [Sphingobacterium endophyticum]